jgi:enamine deaminase RidA (YjgF/YER057c/UK114 family)
MKILQPEGWAPARGYSNGVIAEGRIVFVAGQIGWDADARLVSSDFVEQTRLALQNVVEVLAVAGAGPERIARMTWYVVDKQRYLDASRQIGKIYRELFGNHYPAMTLVVVADLLEHGALVEIEATAVVPV